MFIEVFVIYLVVMMLIPSSWFMYKIIYLLLFFLFLSGCSSVNSFKKNEVEIKDYDLKPVIKPNIKSEKNEQVVLNNPKIKTEDIGGGSIFLEDKKNKSIYVDKIAEFFKIEAISSERIEVVPYFWFAYEPPEYSGVLNNYEIKDDKIFFSVKNGYNLINVHSQLDKKNIKFDNISKVVNKKLENYYVIVLPKFNDRIIVKLSDLKNKKHYVLIEPVKQ